MFSNVSSSINKQHLVAYICLFVFWLCLRVFSQNAFDLGWGFFSAGDLITFCAIYPCMVRGAVLPKLQTL